MDARKALIIKGLNAYYGKAQVLCDLSLKVHPGEKVAILGWERLPF